VDDSNSRLATLGDHSLDEQGFTEKIEMMTMKASGKGYLMEKLGSYIAEICENAATHQ
jgi:predicted choloylglycine hydrolase